MADAAGADARLVRSVGLGLLLRLGVTSVGGGGSHRLREKREEGEKREGRKKREEMEREERGDKSDEKARRQRQGKRRGRREETNSLVSRGSMGLSLSCLSGGGGLGLLLQGRRGWETM